MSKVKTQVEAYFKKPLARVIDEDHWQDGKPVIALTRECGVVRQSFMHLCKTEGLKLRSHKEAIALRNTKGESHWAWGKTKENSRAYRLASERLKNKNPSHDPVIAEQIAKSKSITYRENPWPQEIEFAKLLNKTKTKFIFQYPLGPYIIDFFIPKLNLCIEVDSKLKWGAVRKQKCETKDAFLRNRGFKILRVCKSALGDTRFIQDVFKQHNIVAKR